jgi:hypothetical protein
MARLFCMRIRHGYHVLGVRAMPSQDDILAQQALLEAHRQTLGVLLTQQAQLGEFHAPPAIANGIRAARGSIAQIKQLLRGWNVDVEDLPNDVEPPGTPADAAPHALPSVPSVGGDMIVGNVGAGAQGVAIGKAIYQALADGAAADPDADRRTIDALLARLERDLANGVGQIDAATATMAAFQIRLLAGELGKTGARAAPSASTVSQVGDWLADQVPPLRDALAALFTAPAVLRALHQADAPLDVWLRRRFGA